MEKLGRRELLTGSIGVIVALPHIAPAAVPQTASPTPQTADSGVANALVPPTEGSISVAFLISDGAVIIDFCGPWEVFQDARIPGRKDPLFVTYTVAETLHPIRASGGMQITPDYSYESAPPPKVLVIPAQSASSEATMNWIRKVSTTSEVTMSVCNGAYLLAQSGLLSGKTATIHHGSYVNLAVQYPDIRVRRGARFVEAGNLATAGGLSSGIDLALRVVERYFGRALATQTAFDIEYQGQGWKDPNSNAVYAQRYVSTAGHPVCVVCGMEVNPNTDPHAVYKGVTYYFCGDTHKKLFEASPEDFVALGRTGA